MFVCIYIYIYMYIYGITVENVKTMFVMITMSAQSFF